MNFNNYNRHIDDRDRLMNKWRRAASPELRALIRDVITQLENYEKYFNLRKRARKADDRVTFDGCIEALVCDLIHRALTSENMKGRIAVSLDTSIKATRYKAITDSHQFPYIVDLMTKPEMDWLEVCEIGGWQIGKRTAVRATERLIGRIDHWDIETTDIELKGEQEIVIQKTGKHDPKNAIDGRAEWIDYKESNLSKKYRREVREINEQLRTADIGYTGTRLIDLTDTRLQRYFNNASFKQGGRLFGGFWQQLRARQAKLVTINGEAIGEVDFECMQVALARAAAGVPHDLTADAYDIDVIDTKPGEEVIEWNPDRLRKGIKKLLASMLFSKRQLKRWPKETQCHFPPGTKVRHVCQAIEKAHPGLQDFWYTGAGYRFMFTESQILVRVLLKLKQAGVVALPKHDCVLVPYSKKYLASKIMRETFEELTGGRVSVTVNGSKLQSVSAA
ncbi:MAG TPA: hypothetical protein PKK10_11660 [Woeseiaceae bacterium]|nr:hypothetical protein [Woeseiaceae bacterium]